MRSPPVDWQINQRERSAIRERDRMRVGFAKEFASAGVENMKNIAQKQSRW